MEVVLGSGWPGILLHEAIGHGLEGDFNRKKTSAFCWPARPAHRGPGVTVVDDGTIPDRRGSLTVDDEGTPTSRTTMIEDGILVGYIQDRLNARLMGMRATGNGRRQSYAHAPMPRMTNTIMLDGEHTPEEMIGSVKRGLYAVNFGGGQVDITSGKFVFSASEAYLIEDGRVGRAGEGRHADRQWARCADQGDDGRQRHGARSRDRHLRQERPGRAGGRGSADHEDGRPHRGRHGELASLIPSRQALRACCRL